MKVCFVAGTLGRGGAERQLVYMLRALKLEGVDIKLLCLTRGEAFEADVKDLGVDVQWVGSSGNRIERLRKITKAIREYKADVIQSSHFYTNLYAALAGKLLRIPAIGAIRSDLFSELAADRIFGRWQVALPDHLITNSDIAFKRVVDRGLKPSRIDLVRNIVEQPADGSDTHTSRKGVCVLFVGRLGREKRPEIFVRMAAAILSEQSEFELRFKMVGDGPLRFELERLRDDLGLSREQLEFAGEQLDMNSVYREADILVLTSSYEGTPNVILEAMVHGLPVVATRVGGVPEIVTDDTGYLVDPSDFRSLCEAAKKLVFDRDRREVLGNNAKRRVSNNHSLAYLRQRLPEIYARKLSSKMTR